MKFEGYITTDIHGYKILWRANDERQRHAHLRNMHCVKTLLCLIHKDILPRDEYLRESCRRLLDESEYNRLKEKKTKYYNSKNRWR